MKNISRLFDLLEAYQHKFQPKDDAVAGKKNGSWVRYSIDHFIKNAQSVATYLIRSGLKPEDKVASIVNNSPEWNFIDMGIMMAGGIHVPIYPTSSTQDFEFILKHSEAKFIFISGKEIFKKIEGVLEHLPDLNQTIGINNGFADIHFEDILHYTQQEKEFVELQKRSDAIQEDDVATLIYTSGTTGTPKGVMLSHKNIISNFMAVSYIPQFGEDGKALSFLPLCHVYERMLNYTYLHLGISIYYAEHIGTIMIDIQDIKPDMMTAVPRFLEKVYERIVQKGHQLKGVKRYFFDMSMDIAKSYYPEKENNFSWYKVKLQLCRKLVFSKWKDALGGNFKIIVSGGAALNKELAQIFWAANIPVYEGYGMSETSPVIAVTNNDEKGISFGSVGPPIKGVEIQFTEEKEILVKGPNLMKGYYKDQVRTNEVIDEQGWLHTGDIGEFNSKGHLIISGRKKEIFKTSGGKYIAPVAIENKLKSSPFIENAMVVGENEKFASALIVPDFDFLKKWCKKNYISFSNHADIIQNKEVRYRVLAEVQKVNKTLGNTEKVQKFRFCQNVWSVDKGELTPTLKLKRDIVKKNYKHLIEDIYK